MGPKQTPTLILAWWMFLDQAWFPFLRRIGFISFGEGDGLRLRWLQVTVSPGIGAKWELWENDSGRRRWGLYLHVLLFKIYLKLWRTNREFKVQDYSHYEWWGFDWTWTREWHSTFWFGWPGKRRTCFDLPWAWRHWKTWHLDRQGNWVDEKIVGPILIGKPYVPWRENPEAMVLKLPFKYTLRSGKVQEATATVTVRKAEHRWLLSHWLRCPWPRMVNRSIDIEFDREIGERSGSWKGGCIGCSWSIKGNETPEETLRRMEKERTFR